MNVYNVTQYVIPAHTLLVFSSMSEEKKIIIKLLSGSADLLYGNTRQSIPLEEYELPHKKNLFPRLRSNTLSDFILLGIDYVFHAIQTLPGIEKMLFEVSHFEDCLFILEENTQLQIFVVEDIDSDVFISCPKGNCQTFGQNIPKEGGLLLVPCSAFVIRCRDNAQYSVRVSGVRRRVKVSLTDYRFNEGMRIANLLFQRKCSLAKKTEQTILVVGPTNTGKTSFCHSLLNTAIDEGVCPVYINLDIRRCIPGTISLSEIHCRYDVSVGFAHNFQTLLHFGNVVFNSNTLQLYDVIVGKMGKLLTLRQSSRDASRFPTIIDMCGMLGQSIITIKCVLKSFTVKQIIYIGNDINDYENLKKALPSTLETKFLPAPEDLEPKSERWEANYVDFKIREYFYGQIKRPVTPNHFVVKIENLRVYRVMTEIDDFELVNGRSDQFQVERISCGPNLENYLLAFMGDGDLDDHNLAVAEMKYYVCFETVDLKSKTVTVLGPGNESFAAGILLMSDLQMRKDVLGQSEISENSLRV